MSDLKVIEGEVVKEIKISTKKGGYRPGAGRKKKALLIKDLAISKRRKAVLEHISDADIKAIVDRLVAAAKRKDGVKEAKYLLDQIIGKPLQATDITTGGEQIGRFNDEQVNRIAERITRRSANGVTPGPETLN